MIVMIVNERKNEQFIQLIKEKKSKEISILSN